MLTQDGCRARQQRLIAALAEQRLDLFVTANYRTVYYFTGQLMPADAPCAFLAWSDGRTAIVAPTVDIAVADEKRQVAVYTPERAIALAEHMAITTIGAFI